MAEDGVQSVGGDFSLCQMYHPNERLAFNICGAKYEILESTFQKFPNTLLADRVKRAQFWDEERKEYFLDRSRDCFKAVLTFYHSNGIIVRPDGVPETLFSNELEFYGIRKKKAKPERLMPKNDLQKRVWCLFEYPDTSNAARVLAWFSCSVVLLSIVLFCVETLPAFEKHQDGSRQSDPKHEEVFFLLEAACIAWFTFEYLVRFISAPCKRKFLVAPLNVIDLVAILPFFISFAVDNQDSNVSSMAVLRAVRLVRVFRIFKLSRYSKGLQILGLTLKASLAELGLLAFFLSVGVVLFSSAVYYAEMDANKELFKSIPHSFWWAIVTMTTVGYGDMFPITLSGKVVGSLCAFMGILAIALPVPVIVANFEHFYNTNHEDQETTAENAVQNSKYDKLRQFVKNIKKRRNNKAQIQSV